MPVSLLTIFANGLIGAGAYEHHFLVPVVDVFGIVTLPNYFRFALHENN